jgi:hypothetical protein
VDPLLERLDEGVDFPCAEAGVGIRGEIGSVGISLTLRDHKDGSRAFTSDVVRRGADEAAPPLAVAVTAENDEARTPRLDGRQDAGDGMVGAHLDGDLEGSRGPQFPGESLEAARVLAVELVEAAR